MANLKVNQPIDLKRYLVWTAGVVIALLVISWLVGWLTTGSLVVTTNSPHNSISITQSALDKTKVITKTLKSGQTVRLKPGHYLVTAQFGSSAKAAAVTVNARQSQKVELNLLSNVPQPELVANANSNSFVANTNQLIYVDQSSQNLFMINGQNSTSQISQSILFAKVQWTAAGFGVGEDNSGDFYMIQNDSVTSLATPSQLDKLAPFAVSPDGHIYIGNGKTIWSGQPSTGLNTYYTTNQTISALAATDSLLAVMTTSGIDLVKSGIKTGNLNLVAQSGSWSPNGKLLAVSGKSVSAVLDDGLSLTAVIPVTTTNSLTWVDSGTLAYSSSNQLWTYTLSSQTAVVVAAAPTHHALLSTSLSEDNSYIYVSVENTPNSANDLTIQRFGLNNQSAPASVLSIENNFPWLIGRCLLSLTNFSSPPTIDYYGGKPEDDCPTVARDYISSLGVDPNIFTYQETNVPPDEPSQ